MSPVFYSSPQNGAFSSSCPIFQKIVQSKKKKKIQLFLDRTCTFVLAPVFNTSHREWSFSCALDGQVKNWRAEPKGTSDRETAGKIVFCSLLPQKDLQAAFIFNFYQKFLQRGFFSFRQLPEYCLNVQYKMFLKELFSYFRIMHLKYDIRVIRLTFL